MKKNIFILILFFVIVACTNKTVSDYTSLKQKALEIPPDFQLLPPSDKTEAEAAEMASDTVKDTDLKNILLEGNEEDMSAENNNNNGDDLQDFIDSNFSTEKEEIN